MTSLTSSEWQGAFLPFNKHYRHRKAPGERHPEELPEHIDILSVTMLDDDEIDEDELDLELDVPLDELVQLGTGPIPYLVIMQFKGDSPERVYAFIVNADGTPQSDYALRRLVASHFVPQ